MDVVGIVGVVVLVAGVEVSVVKVVDVTEDDTVSVVVAAEPVDVAKVEAGFVVDRQPLASIQIHHSHNRTDSFIIQLNITLFLCHKMKFAIIG